MLSGGQKAFPLSQSLATELQIPGSEAGIQCVWISLRPVLLKRPSRTVVTGFLTQVLVCNRFREITIDEENAQLCTYWGETVCIFTSSY